jgi:hypothetical protein
MRTLKVSSSSAAQSMRRSIPELGDFHHLQHVFDSGLDIFRSDVKLQWSENNFLENRWRKELNIGILKDKSHFCSEKGAKLIVLNRIENLFDNLVIEGIKFS